MPGEGSRPVLLVEDDETFGGLVARHLEARSHPVTLAPTAEEAREALRGGLRPALVLLDLNLPDETGWSLLRGDELRMAGSPPVVIMTAIAVRTSRLREYGVAGYLPKPFSLQTLLATVERLTGEGVPEAT
jgi:DNA-binding response OmpR family regulator